MSDLINREDAIEVVDAIWRVTGDVNVAKVWQQLKDLPSAELKIIHCRDCEYGEIDQDGWWYCTNFGGQVGESDGSGYCADAEKRR